MSIDPNENRADEWVLRRMDADLHADPGIADAIEQITKAQPLIPSGGRAEELVKPRIEQANSLRDTARIWAPGAGGTAVVVVVLVDPFDLDLPMTGPLMAYGIAWAGFGWWTAAGRPGPRDSFTLLVRHGATVCRWIGIAAAAVYGLSAKAVRATANTVRRPRPIEQAG
ncbi:hypothetical protein [Nocardia nova]|uniref:hypothetical protein n=1 Tax=Nocardia nova TaxID=37330 RepID=UPI00189575F8|nr:hypothetical protein [Nocardia nova]MBF6150285.1 hypothetical protein [Nocardia nova]